jgi:hypothetical protein
MDYVKGKDLHMELVVALNRGQYTRELWKMVDKIIKKFSRKFTYKVQEQRYDCEAKAHMEVYIHYKKYDIESNKSFAFITQIIKTAFYAQFNQLNYIKSTHARGKEPIKRSLNIMSLNNIHTL